MDAFFDAGSVAVVGVSNSPSNLGRAMAFNLMEFGYQGVIQLVGPKGGVFLGHQIYRSIPDLPEPVDLATLLVPATAVPAIIRQCGERGVRRVVLQSAGFREMGAERRGLEDEILSLLNEYGIRLIGPNCIGIINRANGLAVPFMPMKAEGRPGEVAVLAQSGGVGAMMLNLLAADHLGFSKFASIGNKLNVNENHLIEYLTQRDPKTRTVFAYLEGIAGGRELMQLAFASSKPIIVHKSNHGGAGSVIARSHSASLSTDDQVVEAGLRQCGIIRVGDQREGVEVIKALSLPPMRGRRLAIISRSGGHAVMAADAADEYGFTLPPFPEELLQTVRERSRAGVIQLHNPMDLGDLFDLDLYRELAEQTLTRDDIDGLLFIYNYQGVFDAEPSRRLIASFGPVMEQAGKPVAVCVFTPAAELERNRRAAGFPIFTDPREAVRALSCNGRCHGNERRPLPFADQPPAGIDRDLAAAILEPLPAGPVAPGVLARVLTAYGIPLVAHALAGSEPEAVAQAQAIGYPVALKTAEPGVIHKSDQGGVWLRLANADAVRDAYRRVSQLGPAVLLQRMLEPAGEWLVGGRRDDSFGAVVVAGIGGIYVEVLRRTAIRVGPIGAEEAGRMLDDCGAAAFLDGVRGRPRLDRKALEDILARVSWLLHDHPQLRELDLNPVAVQPAGALALDWRATTA